jgi:hypothetical protein
MEPDTSAGEEARATSLWVRRRLCQPARATTDAGVDSRRQPARAGRLLLAPRGYAGSSCGCAAAHLPPGVGARRVGTRARGT